MRHRKQEEMQGQKTELATAAATPKAVKAGWIDSRSLALVRLLFAAWLLMDWTQRFLFDTIGWYTSVDHPSVVPLLDPELQRHKVFIHQFLFYRGTVELQQALAGVQLLLVILWGLGIRCALVGPLLWLSTASLHGRNEMICDGADCTVRQFLFWAMFLPMDAHYALAPSSPNSWIRSGSRLLSNCQLLGIAPFAYVLQIAAMYWTMIANRSPGPCWTYPEFSATYYALTDGFVHRDWSNAFAVANPELCRIGTAVIVVLEVIAPILLVFTKTSAKKSRYIGVGILVLLIQAPLLTMIRLHRFQSIAIITALGALPSSFWGVDKSPKPKEKQQAAEQKAPSLLRRLGTFLPWFFMFYMIHMCVGLTPWVDHHFIDDGNLGELLRFDQHWKQFSPNPPRTGYWVSFEGYSGEAPRFQVVDLLAAVKTNDFTPISKDQKNKTNYDFSHMPTYRYPNGYWEKYLWAAVHKNHTQHRGHYVNLHLCHRWKLDLWRQIDANPELTPREREQRKSEKRFVVVREYGYSTNPPHSHPWHTPVKERQSFHTECPV